jgi:hypothetical protein
MQIFEPRTEELALLLVDQRKGEASQTSLASVFGSDSANMPYLISVRIMPEEVNKCLLLEQHAVSYLGVN